MNKTNKTKIELTPKTHWLCIEGSDGTTYVPLSECIRITAAQLRHMNESGDFSPIAAIYDGRPDRIYRAEIIVAYGLRLACPFGASTDWALFLNRREAVAEAKYYRRQLA